MTSLVFRRTPFTVDCTKYGLPASSEIDSLLASIGHIRLRGLSISSAETMEQQYGHLIGNPMDYKGGTNYRDTMDKSMNVLGVGHEPPHLTLTQHNEMSYCHRWPGRFALGCIENTLPSNQGITPICDNKKLLEYLPRDLHDKMMDLGVKNIRTQIDHYNCDHLPLETRKEYTSWQKTFMTECKEDVERECERNGYRYRWNDDGSLYYEFVRPSFVRHPQHGDVCLFNNFANGVNWYKGWQPFDAMEGVKRPFWNQWGNGQECSEEEIKVMEGLYSDFMMGDTWKSGDLLLLDNQYATHGRMPFDPEDGQRNIGVMMGNEVVRTSFDPNGIGQCTFANND